MKKCIKNFSPKQGYLKQFMISLRDGKKQLKKYALELEFSGGQVSCPRV
jgi:hypothetical protein